MPVNLEVRGAYTEAMGSLLKGVYKQQDHTFVDVLSQLARGEFLTLGGETYSIKDNMVGVSLAMNKYLADREALNTFLMKVFNFEDKIRQQLDSLSS